MAVKENVGVFESYDRAMTGPKVDESEWDRSLLPKETKRLKEKYKLKFDRKKFIPTDEDMIDRLFQAGLELLTTMGILCVDTGRVIKYTEDEVYTAMSGVPYDLTIGEGRDKRLVLGRKYDDPRPPLNQGGPTGAPITEDIFVKVHEAYAKEPLVDMIVDGTLDTIKGRPLTADTPWDIAASKQEVAMIRLGTANTGRGGMGLQGPETPLTPAGVIAADFPGGMRPCDSHEVSQLCELKIDLPALVFTAHYKLAGDIIMCEQMPIMGGWAGGLEETTIVCTATHLASPVLVSADWHLDGPTHVAWGITTTRDTLIIAGHAACAIEKHTHFILGNQYYTAAGPCTEMCLLEAAAQAVTDTASGREIMSGCASLKGTQLDYTTPVEARMMAYAARAVAGMDINKVNVLLDKLVATYEKNFNQAPRGKTFQECYDLKTLYPTEEHTAVLEQALNTMRKIGFKFKF